MHSVWQTQFEVVFVAAGLPFGAANFRCLVVDINGVESESVECVRVCVVWGGVGEQFNNTNKLRIRHVWSLNLCA